MTTQIIRRIVYVGFSLLLPIIFLGLLSQVDVYASNYVVDTTADEGPGSLRQAVLDANQNPGPDTITFDLASNSVITLTSGELIVSDTVIIDGGTALPAISGNYQDRVLSITSGITVAISNLIIRDGYQNELPTKWAGGAILNQGDLKIFDSQILSSTARTGGGIYNMWGANLHISNTVFGFNSGSDGGGFANRGHAVIINSLFRENEAEYGGGAIDNVGPTLIISKTVFLDNTAGDYGGAVYNYNYEAFIYNSHFENNSAVDSGGAIDSDYGILHLENSTVENNVADRGGGIFNYGQLFVKNSTISKNTAVGTDAEDGGGGIMQAYRNITMTHVTVADNAAPNQIGRDGIWQSEGNTLIQQSIVAGNGTENCTLNTGSWDGTAFNLSDDASCAGFTQADPMLAPLGDYGGDTSTYALLKGSPAIDAGDNSLCAERDQRGETRPLDGDGDGTAICDIGAVEIRFMWDVYLPMVVR